MLLKYVENKLGHLRAVSARNIVHEFGVR